MQTIEYWSSAEIDATGANYRIVYGERGPGKTYQFKKHAIDNFLKTGKQFAYTRRHHEDVKPSKMVLFFNDIYSYLTEQASIYYPNYIGFCIGAKNGAFTLYGDLENGREPIAVMGYYFSLSTAVHNKSVPYPDVNLFCYDEFLADESKGEYELPNEFSTLLNLISTIKRKREDFLVYMFGNSVNRNSSLLRAMNINVRDIPQGSIKCYEYRSGDVVNRVAVEYHRPFAQSADSEAFFTFNNPREMMIRDGSFEVDTYPHFTEDDFYELRAVDGVVFDCPDFRLYGYAMTNGELWISPQRLVFSGDYFTMTSGDTIPGRRVFNWRSGFPKIDRIVARIERAVQNGFVKYYNDVTGDDFRHFLLVANRATA